MIKEALHPKSSYRKAIEYITENVGGPAGYVAGGLGVAGLGAYGYNRYSKAEKVNKKLKELQATGAELVPEAAQYAPVQAPKIATEIDERSIAYTNYLNNR